MSNKKNTRRTLFGRGTRTKPLLVAAAGAVTTAGFLIASAPAPAHATFPLAPAACTQWQWGTGVVLIHATGNRTQINANGSELSRNGAAFYPRDAAPQFGSPTGSIRGNEFNITVRWFEGPGAGYRTEYRGNIDAEGFATGTTSNTMNNDRGSVRSAQPLVCAVRAEAAPTPTPHTLTLRPLPERPTATAVGDVDVYDRPNSPAGAGNRLGILRKDTKVQLIGACQPEDWCQVRGPDVPGGQGFVWGHLNLP